MSHYITNDGITIAYETRGAGRPVLLVHGWMTSGEVWRATVDQLCAQRQCIVPDLRGTGASSAPSAEGYTLSRMVADLVGLLAHLDVQDVVVVGHGMGAQLAQGVAMEVRQRVSGLILMNPIPLAGLELPKAVHELFRTSAQDRTKQRAILDAACLQLSIADRDRLLDVAGAIAPACIEGCYDAWRAGAYADRAGHLAVPTLVVASSDPLLKVELLQASVVEPLPQAALTRLPGPGHYLPVEQPQLSAALIDGFVAGRG